MTKIEHLVIPVRATGIMPDAVAQSVQDELDDAISHGWQLQMIQPIIYNSATTGYLLLILQRTVGSV